MKNNNDWEFSCPVCDSPLTKIDKNEQRCPQDNRVYARINGIWHFLPPEREQFYDQFIREYETVRQHEGRGDDSDAYYQALPFQDLSGTMAEMWKIRALSFQLLLDKIITPLENGRSLKILDVGAGNGWLSHQLAKRGHYLAAIDLTINAFDGLGAHSHYDTPFLPIQAEFDNLPLASGQADLLLFNASFHYAQNYETTIQEGWRLLKNNGRLLIIDSPVYHNPASGQQMVIERETAFQKTYGFSSNAIKSQNYLSYNSLNDLGIATDTIWNLLWPTPRWRWTIRRLRTALRGQREPAQFPLIVGKAKNSDIGKQKL